MFKASIFICSAVLLLAGCQLGVKPLTDGERQSNVDFLKQLNAKDREKLTYQEELTSTVIWARPADVNLLNMMSRSLDSCLREENGASMARCSRQSVPTVDEYYFANFYDGSKSPPPGHVAVSHAYLKWSDVMQAMQSAPNRYFVEQLVIEARSAIANARF